MTSKPRARFSGGASGRRAEVLRAIAADRALSTAERCVLFAVEAHVGYAERDTGRCWPAVVTIGEASGMSERNARRTLAKLHKIGWLHVEPQTRRGQQISSVYVVTPPGAEPVKGEPSPAS